jgi:hypothetical protein
MSMVTVYSFLLYDPQQDVFVRARGKCIREKIELIGGHIIEDTAQNVDETLLNENGRYHEEKK